MDLKSSQSFQFLNNKEVEVEKSHAYEKVTNSKIGSESSNPKIGFDTRDYYNEAHRLSKEKPLWKDESENTIYHFLPDATTRYSRASQNIIGKSDSKKEEVANEPEEKTDIFQTTFKKEGCSETKARLAREDPIKDAYMNAHHHVFKSYSIPLNQDDFRVNCFNLIIKLVKIQMSSSL